LGLRQGGSKKEKSPTNVRGKCLKRGNIKKNGLGKLLKNVPRKTGRGKSQSESRLDRQSSFKESAEEKKGERIVRKTSQKRKRKRNDQELQKRGFTHRPAGGKDERAHVIRACAEETMGNSKAHAEIGLGELIKTGEGKKEQDNLLQRQKKKKTRKRRELKKRLAKKK